ncbi:hypothetical protein PMAYCL1PPCAC_00671, partial [Pristionchus mayeri]
VCERRRSCGSSGETDDQMRCISNPGNLKQMMNLLKEKSKIIQFEAFHVRRNIVKFSRMRFRNELQTLWPKKN